MTYVVSIVVAIITAILGQPYLQQAIFKKRLRKIINALESHALFDKYQTDFKDDFILPDLKESYFYIQTGIRTNEKSIQKYIDLKNKLGLNYTWKDIKIAKPHYDLTGERIKIRVDKFARVSCNVAIILSITLFLIALVGGIYLSTFEIQHYSDIFLILFMLFIPTIAGINFLYLTTSVIKAQAMQKRLKNIDNQIQ